MKLDKIQKQSSDFNHILDLIANAQNNVYKAINEGLVLLNWEIGKYVSQKVNSGDWGDGIVLQLANYIKSHYPNLKGFSKRGLYRMRQFYETYHSIEKVSSLLTQISWSNHLMILSKCKSLEEKQFYILISAKEKLSFRELKRQIESSVYERTLLADVNVSTPLTQIQKEVNQVFKDTYVFEFLDLPTGYSENDLKSQILINIKKFLLELGGGFSFIGQEYRVQVGMHDYYIDLLFFHRELQCLVAIELKTVEFTPEHLGQLNFYLEALGTPLITHFGISTQVFFSDTRHQKRSLAELNEYFDNDVAGKKTMLKTEIEFLEVSLDNDVKMTNENPSIGILLCKGKDSEVVEFALRRTLSPALIADYETKLINKKILQQKLHDLFLLYDKKKG